MPGLFNVYRLQGILTLIQTAIIIGGALLTRATLKLFGYPGAPHRFHEFPIFVRDWWPSLVFIPAIWCIATIWSEEHSHWFSKRNTLITGSILAVSAGIAMAMSVLSAATVSF